VDVIAVGGDGAGSRIVTRGRVRDSGFAANDGLFVTLEVPAGAAVLVASLADGNQIRLAIPGGTG